MNIQERRNKALFSDERNYIYQVFFSMLLATGCRIGELCALSWDDIDFSEIRPATFALVLLRTSA